jgi:hypothetical protein
MTDHVPAAAKGLPNLTRRTLLAGLAAAPVAALPTVAIAAAPMNAQDRLQAAIAELKAAAYDLWPDIDAVAEHYGQPGDTAEAAPVMVILSRSARVRAVSWSGPGLYECRNEKTGQQPVYWVEKTPRGYRCALWWRGKPQGKWRRFSEARLRLLHRVVAEG